MLEARDKVQRGRPVPSAVRSVLEGRDPVMVGRVYDHIRKKKHKEATGMDEHEVWYDYRVYNRHLFPDDGAVLIGMSHIKEEDIAVYLQAIRPRRAFTLAKSEMWEEEYRYIGYLLQLAGVIKTHRQKLTPSTIKHARRALREGEAVGVFGEGTRIEGPQRGPVQEGIAYLSVTENVPISTLALAWNGSLVFNPEWEAREELCTALFAPLLYPNPKLPRDEAIADILSRHEQMLQETYDLASTIGRKEAYDTAMGIVCFNDDLGNPSNQAFEPPIVW